MAIRDVNHFIHFRREKGYCRCFDVVPKDKISAWRSSLHDSWEFSLWIFIFTVRSNQYIIIPEFDMQTIARAVEYGFQCSKHYFDMWCRVDTSLMGGWYDR